MAFAEVQVNGAADDTSGTALGVALTSVGAGSLVVVWFKHEGAATTYSVSDGTTTFTPVGIRDHANSDLHAGFFFLPSANAGTKTYTMTLGAARTFRRIQAWEFTYSGGTAALDVHGELSGSDGLPVSPAVTTTTADQVALGGYGEYSGAPAGGFTINSIAADASRSDSLTSSWYKIETATFTSGTASMLGLGGSQAWICNIATFKVAAAGGGPTAPIAWIHI